MKMFGNRLELTLRLHLDGDLHIGAGVEEEDDRLLSQQDKEDKKDPPPEIALVQRDVDGNAVIPATSLKGALRSEAPLTEEQFNRLLGEVGEVQYDDHGDLRRNKGGIARLWLGWATAEAAADDDGRFAGATKNDCTRTQGFVKTAVSIHRQSGAAENKLLYNREMIGAGTKFSASATLFLDDADETDLVELMTDLLAPLAQEPGLAIGGQQRQAGGCLRLDGIDVFRATIDATTLDLEKVNDRALGRHIHEEASKRRRAKPERIRLMLTCDGPFISIRDKVKVPDRDGFPREETQPLTRSDDKPHLWPSSLLGVLRTRAAWLAEVERLRANGGQSVDGVADDRKKVVRRKDEADVLSPVERLFGVAGWRGLLRVASLEPTAGRPLAMQKMTSVTIDRFTGGGIDERLFNELVFVGAAFVCDLELDNGRGVTPEDSGMLKTLLADIEAHGLELGHGGSKGFGWFDVAIERLAAAGGAP